MAAMASRLLFRSFRRPPPPLRPPAGLLHRSLPTLHTRDVRRLHVLPRALLHNIRWFRGQSFSASSKAALPRCRVFFRNVLSASFVSTSAAAVLYLKDDWYDEDEYDEDEEDDQEPPPAGERHGRRIIEREKRKWTDVLIALNLLVHGVDVLTKRKLLLWGVKSNDLIRKGQLWRLATSSLLHGGMFHITCNMLALDDIGSVMEEVTGPGRFLAIYCTSALTGSLMSYRFTTGDSVGASDAIFGLTGAQTVYTWRHRESLEKSKETLKEIAELILFSLGMSLALRIFKIRVDDWSHLGGFLGGAAVEWMLGPNGKQNVPKDLTAEFEDKAPDLSDY